MIESTEENLFYAGNFKEVIKLYENQSLKTTRPELIVGAFVFLGDIEKGQITLEKYKLQKSTQALFFISLGLIRASKYEQAKKILLNLLKTKKNKEDLFYVQQGLGFYQYFCGRYSKALVWAGRAQKKAKDSYQKLICYDLLSHILVHLGQIQKGLLFAEKAHDFAIELRNKSAAEAIQVGKAIYESQFGEKTNVTLLKLLDLKLRFQDKNTYSYLNLTLEYVRRLNLEGKIESAERELEKVKKTLFSSSLNRQKSTWCFRQAHIFYLKRQPESSLNMIEAALDYIDQSIDLCLTLQILGLKYKILKTLKTNQVEILQLEDKIKKMTFLTQDATALSYAYRYGWTKKPMTEDPFASFFHQWIREGYKNYGLIKKVVEKKWVSLFVDLVADHKKNFIYLEVLPKHLMLLGSDQILFNSGLTTLIRQTLLVLANNSFTKKEFVELIWGYEYDSLRHDSLIYTLLNRVREVLGPLSNHLIINDQQIYLRDCSVRVYEHMEIPQKMQDSIPEMHLFNRRQLEILDYLSKKKYTTMSEVAQILHVSKMTALRDLNALLSDKKIRRIGKGRAISYHL